MALLSLSLPAMYGDHHVVEVRRILLDMPGVEDVYASSAYHTVEVSYDPSTIAPDSIEAALHEAGYSGELDISTEHKDSYRSEDPLNSLFRHTKAYQQLSTMISFAQNTSYRGRPLWPCPGIGVIRTKIIEDDVGYG